MYRSFFLNVTLKLEPHPDKEPLRPNSKCLKSLPFYFIWEFPQTIISIEDCDVYIIVHRKITRSTTPIATTVKGSQVFRNAPKLQGKYKEDRLLGHRKKTIIISGNKNAGKIQILKTKVRL